MSVPGSRKLGADEMMDAAVSAWGRECIRRMVGRVANLQVVDRLREDLVVGADLERLVSPHQVPNLARVSVLQDLGIACLREGMRCVSSWSGS